MPNKPREPIDHLKEIAERLRKLKEQLKTIESLVAKKIAEEQIELLTFALTKIAEFVRELKGRLCFYGDDRRLRCDTCERANEYPPKCRVRQEFVTEEHIQALLKEE